jgi:hypothetical protein
MAAGTLVALAALSGALGAAWTALFAVAAFLDPTLLGDPSLALSVAATGLAWTALGVGLPAGLAWGIWTGAAEARVGATLFAVLALLGPGLPFGAVILYGIWFDEESVRFFREVAARRAEAAKKAG